MVAHPPVAPTSARVDEATRLALVPQPAEKRAGARRRRVTIPATILCPDGRTCPCVIRDMSATGARLSVSRRHPLPTDFAIAVAGQEGTFRVRCAWQRGDFAGVTLVTG